MEMIYKVSVDRCIACGKCELACAFAHGSEGRPAATRINIHRRGPELGTPIVCFQCHEGVQHGERYQVKRIKVKSGERLSLQKHHHRSEHWIVVRGTAEVTRGEEVFTLSENESTYIPLGVVHRLANPGRLTLELIEVQVGAYLGEDDIVRFEDQYGR